MSRWDFFLVPFSGDAHGHRIALHLERNGEEIRFQYRVEGRGIKCALFGQGSRRDELWNTTCFEFFLGVPNSQAYFEINMSTSGDWNVYAFDSYRVGMKRAEGVHASPMKSIRASEAGLELDGQLSLRELPGLLVGPVVLGATAVVEYVDGTKEYWALAHKAQKPDFHVRESFVAKV
jgi:hypothetical protein